MSLILNSGFTIGPGVVLDANPYIPPPPPSVVSSGLVLHLDASNPYCYTGETGIVPHQHVIDDLSIYAGYPYAQAGYVQNPSYSITWTDDGAASYFTWPSNTYADDYINITEQRIYRDFTIVFQPDFAANGFGGLFGMTADKSMRFYSGVNGTGPWVAANPGNGDDWADNPTTYYINGQVSDTTVAGWNIMGGAKNNVGFPEPSDLRIGTSWYQNRGFQGKIAVVLMYDRVLTDQEQLHNYNVLRARFGL
jgi:hypothetical protein